MSKRGAPLAGPLTRGWARLRAWSWSRRSTATEVPLSQHRLFVVPTGFGLAWAGLIVILFLFGTNYQNNLAYGLAFWLLAIALVALVRGWRNLLGVRVTITPEGEAFAGDEARLRVTLAASRDRQALAACLGRRLGRRAGRSRTRRSEREGRCAVADLVDGEASLTIGWPVTLRGDQPLPRLRLESDWPLGLVRALAWVESPETLLVYPRPWSSRDPAMVASRPLDESSPPSATPKTPRDTQEFAGLKRYVPGDAPSRLAWKQWSRTGVLATKHFSEPPAAPTWLDYAAVTGDVETRLSWLCYQVNAYHGRGEPFGLRLPGLTLPPASGSVQRRRALSALARFSLAGSEPTGTVHDGLDDGLDDSASANGAFAPATGVTAGDARQEGA